MKNAVTHSCTVTRASGSMASVRKLIATVSTGAPNSAATPTNSSTQRVVMAMGTVTLQKTQVRNINTGAW